jgi:uncharacterized membrane protein
LDRSLNLDDVKGYTVSVLIALIFISILLAGYYLILKPLPREYMSIYLLNSQKKALNYSELVINQNNSFNVWVEVENHLGKRQYSEVLLKVTNSTIRSFPVEANVYASYVKTVENEKTWENLATVSLNETGNYWVIFELWVYDEKAGALQFSDKVCVLNIEVIE